jgi:hypothetical protein
MPGVAYQPGTGIDLDLAAEDEREPVDHALDAWLAGDIETAARLMRHARRDAAQQNDRDEVAELDLLVTKMRSNLTGDNLAHFDAVLAGRRLEQLRTGRGRGLHGGDYAFCLIVMPFAAVPAALGLAATSINFDGLLRALFFVTLTLSAGAGVWAGWRQSPTAGCLVAIAAFAASWLVLTVAAILTVGST